MAKLTFYNRTTKKSLWDEDRNAFVYRQYDGRRDFKGRNWYVKVSDPDMTPCIDDGSKLVRCDYGEQCFVMPESVDSGELTLYQDVGGKLPLKPNLYIDAANLSDDEVKAIIRRLQQLALQVNSPISTNSSTSVKEKQEQNTLNKIYESYQHWIEQTQKFLELCQTVQKQWPLILKTPARDMQLLPQVVDMSSPGKPLSANLVQKACQRPEARRLETLCPSETPNTAENQYIVFVLDRIIQDKDNFAAKLTCCASQINQELEQFPDDSKQHETGEIQQHHTRLQNAGLLASENKRQADKKQASLIACDLQMLSDELAEATKQIRGYQQSSLLKNIKPRLPHRPSDRLTQSQEYAPVYKAFSKYQLEREKLFIPLKKGLDLALTRMSLRATWQLYELWLLLEVYDALVNRFGFQPVSKQGVKHPLQYLDAVDDELVEVGLAGTEYELQFKHPDTPLITARLSYDCEVYNQNGEIRRPDLHLCFEYKSASYHFVLDAKYRDYNQQGAAIFQKDVIGVAKKKYLEQLVFEGQKPRASFIIHSDPKGKYTFWGGKHHPDFVQEKLPNHQYGAVSVTPTDTQNIDRLLKCFLMYHMGIHNVCWACRQQIVPAQPPRVFGDVYQCSTCPARWVDTWCDNAFCQKEASSTSAQAKYKPKDADSFRNTILKFSTDTDVDTFHKRVGVDNQWWYFCPHCGSGGQKKQSTEREKSKSTPSPMNSTQSSSRPRNSSFGDE